MRNVSTVLWAAVLSTAVGCGDGDATDVASDRLGPGQGPVLAIGDSILEWHADVGQSIPDVYGETAGRTVTNGSVGGARMLAGENRIPLQYAEAARSWARVLIDGGGNDVGGDGCGCGNCIGVVDEIVSSDATTGAMVELVDQITADGAEVVLLGYYAPPAEGEFTECAEEFAAMNERYSALASMRASVQFVGMGDVIDVRADPTLLDDIIHPSVEGARRIGQHIAQQVDGAP